MTTQQMVQFLASYTPAQRTGGPPSPEHMATMNKLVTDMTAAGVLVATGGFLPSAVGARISLSNGDFSVATGVQERPDVGFALLRGSSKEDVIESVKSFLKVAGDGTCELRQLM